MIRPYAWIGIMIGIFFAGLGVGYFAFTNTSNYGNLMQNSQFMQKLMQSKRN